MIDKEYIKMVKEAVEIQEAWKVKDLDRYYFEDLDTNESFIDIIPLFGTCKIGKEDEHHVQFYKEHCVYLPTQEDLQEIYMEKTERPASMLMADFCMWMGDHPYPRDHEVWQDITRLWLTFVMEKMFLKSWNSETGKWEKVWWNLKPGRK